MVSKSFIAYAFLLCFTTSVKAHAAIAPALGVKGGNPARGDVQNPSTAKPCGNVNIAQTIDTSTTVLAAADGTFSPSAIDFNAGGDGSRSIKTVKVDASGTGKTFVAAKMVVNGDANPKSTGTQKLTVQLPAGTKCTGGAAKNLCLASFTTTAGFGNCVVVAQGANAAPAKNATPSGVAKGTKNPPVLRAAVADDQAEIPVGYKKDNSRRAEIASVGRHTASFKRTWSSRESVNSSQPL